MDPSAVTLEHVSAGMADAIDPWSIIGSAAVRLHGALTPVADIDLLCSEGDAVRLCA